MSSSPPLVAAVVPVFNRLETTRRFVERFRSLSYSRKMLVICDDGSKDGTREFLTQQPDVVTVLGDGSLWWSGGTNAAVREALRHQVDYVLTINDDALFEPDYIDKLIAAAQAYPGSIIASQIVQDHAQDHCWSAGASYINNDYRLYALDGFGSRISLLRTLLKPCVSIDTAPGNGVLYPADVFEKVGYFDETWTPQYHGDTLMVQRASAGGVPVRCSLDALVHNDISDHRTAAKVDPLLSIKSDQYAPSIYKSVEVREGPEAAIDCLGDLTMRMDSQFSPEAKRMWKPQRAKPDKWRFRADVHFVQTFSGGAFSKLGYHVTDGLRISILPTASHHEYEITGSGVLSPVLRVRRAVLAYVFVVSDKPIKHLRLLTGCQAQGETQVEDGWVNWYVIPLEVADTFWISFAVVNHLRGRQEMYVVAEENVAPRFRSPS